MSPEEAAENFAAAALAEALAKAALDRAEAERRRANAAYRDAGASVLRAWNNLKDAAKGAEK